MSIRRAVARQGCSGRVVRHARRLRKVKYILLIYGDEKGWGSLSREEMAKVYAAHTAYSDEMAKAGVLREPTTMA